MDSRTSKMNSASPDELALVEGCQLNKKGFYFEGKDVNGVIRITRRRDGETLQFKVLNTLEFTSSRKRMSVIVQDCLTDEITLLCKGADSVIKERLDLDGLENSGFLERT